MLGIPFPHAHQLPEGENTHHPKTANYAESASTLRMSKTQGEFFWPYISMSRWAIKAMWDKNKF